ncbi:MAG TPA: hypothetical protein PK156_19065, partial [Polyangium sp.]|nr:hypothetical protein [Polyangium sp.]
MLLGNFDKWYVDQTHPSYEALADALKMQFPQLRIGIGPASLNDQYYGTNPPKAQIESFIAGFVPTPLRNTHPPDFMRNAPSVATTSSAPRPSPAQAPSPAPPRSAVAMKRGDRIWILIPGIDPVDALFQARLPDGQVLVDLDGVATPVDSSAVYLDLDAAEAAAVLSTSGPDELAEPSEAAPEPPKASPTPPVLSEPTRTDVHAVGSTISKQSAEPRTDVHARELA